MQPANCLWQLSTSRMPQSSLLFSSWFHFFFPNEFLHHFNSLGKHNNTVHVWRQMNSCEENPKGTAKCLHWVQIINCWQNKIIYHGHRVWSHRQVKTCSGTQFRLFHRGLCQITISYLLSHALVVDKGLYLLAFPCIQLKVWKDHPIHMHTVSFIIHTHWVFYAYIHTIPSCMEDRAHGAVCVLHMGLYVCWGLWGLCHCSGLQEAWKSLLEIKLNDRPHRNPLLRSRISWR